MSIETRIHAVEEYLKILKTQVQQGGGGGAGVIGTSIPTADTFALFDGEKHMNSEDMTSQELSNYITSLPQGISKQIHLLDMMDILSDNCNHLYPTLTANNCTGTIANGLNVLQKGKMVCISGRIEITGYTRTGSNPGVQFTYSDWKPKQNIYRISGFRAESPRECVDFAFTTTGLVTIRTRETFTNATGSTLTFEISPIFVCLE